MRINFDFKKIWTVTLMAYIICSTAFSYGVLKPLNTITLYIFLAVSVLLILLRRKITLDYPIITYIAYAVIVLLGALYTPTNESAVMEMLYYYITMTALAFCVVQYIETEKNVHTIIVSFMLAGLALAIYVYAQYGDEFWDLLKEISESDSENALRLDGNLANANTISMITMISAVIAVFYIFFYKSNLAQKLFCIATAAFCLIVSMAAASKKSMIILLVSAFGMWLYLSLGKLNLKRMLQSFLALAVTIVVLIYAINTLPIFSSVIKRFESLFKFLGGGKGTTSEVERFNFIQEGLKIWEQYPIFGAGTYSSLHYFGVYSHSNPIEILMNTGLVGFLVFYGVYLVTGCKFLGNVSLYKRNSKLPVLLFALFLSITICGAAWVYYYERYTMILMITILSGLKVYRKKNQDPQNIVQGNSDSITE